MAIVEIFYTAKCKHCEHFTTKRPKNKNGALSKRRLGWCNVGRYSDEPEHVAQNLKACKKFR